MTDMKMTLLFFVGMGVIAACVQPPRASGKSVLVVGFKGQVSRQDAELMLQEIFEGVSETDYELLFQDPRSLEAVREKYPQRAARAPAFDAIEKPLAYKVYVDLSDEDIDGLIANKDNWENVEFIQRDLQIRTYE